MNEHKDRPCPECGEIHPGGVVIMDDNYLSLATYAERHPKMWKKIEKAIDSKTVAKEEPDR